MKEKPCWYIHFEGEWNSYDEMSEEKDFLISFAKPGCYIIEKIPEGIAIHSMGGGKTAAHKKRRAAKKNPDAPWVKNSIFVVNPHIEVSRPVSRNGSQVNINIEKGWV